MVKILVDSASDVDATEARERSIALISMQVRFGDEEYFDGVNLSHREFFEKLIENTEFPKTSQINETRWAEQFETLVVDGSDVVAITLSSRLSGTYQSAVKAAKSFGGKVFVVDSYNACIGERVLLEYALRLRDGGSGAEEMASRLNEAKKKIKLLAVLDTLKYLKKGGRISSLTAFAGELLSIKPVVAIEEGEVKLIGKAMGSKKGNNLLMQLVQKCGGIDFGMPYVIGYSGLDDSYLKKYLKDSESLYKGKAEEVPAYMIGSTIGAHIGPGGIAVAFFAEK